MFHGIDWKNSDMYNKTIMRFFRVGVDVAFFPYTFEELWGYIRKYGFHEAYKKVYGIGWKRSTAWLNTR